MAIKILLTCTIIFLTTAHCQDFKDIAGDAAVGRVTMPMVYPTLSRISYGFFVMFWAVGLSIYWELETALAAAFIGFSVFMAAFVMLFRSVKADLISFQMYEVRILDYEIIQPCLINLVKGIYDAHIPGPCILSL